MPPKRIESSQKSVNQEGKILLALNDLQKRRIKSIRSSASLYAIPRSTLQARADGRISRDDKRPSGPKLTQYEEDSLIK